ncbi:MAG: hypothetical protein ACHQ1D_13740, partial [Nitrososphaerales archaeon]
PCIGGYSVDTINIFKFRHTSLTNQINQLLIAQQPISSLCYGSFDYSVAYVRPLEFRSYIIISN